MASRASDRVVSPAEGHAQGRDSDGVNIRGTGVQTLPACDEALRASDADFRALGDAIPQVVWITRADGWNIFFNQAWYDYTGLSAADSEGHGWVTPFHPDDAPKAAEAWRQATATGGTYSLEARLRRADGVYRWWVVRGVPRYDETGAIGRWFGTCTDIEEFKQSAERLRLQQLVEIENLTQLCKAEAELAAVEDRYTRLVEGVPDGVYTADVNGRFTSVNRGAAQITGFGRDELIGMSFIELVAPGDQLHVQEMVARALSGTAEVAEIELVAKDGWQVFIEASVHVIEENGERHLEGIARDTTARHQLERQLRHEALHDRLTGLPNRSLFFDRLDQALARGVRNRQMTVVTLLDVDGFKQINDSLGHSAGDELLVELAARFRSVVREGETLARLGGDEFALVAEGLGTEADMIALAERLLSVFSEPCTVAGTARKVVGSLGIAVTSHGEAPEDLLRDADLAMYRVKASGRGGFTFFDIGMREDLVNQVALRSALGDALRENGLAVHYQPIFGLTDDALLAVEALVRWPREGGFVAPDSFIPLAEQTGLIVPIGRFVLTDAARQMRRWRRENPRALPLGVFLNVSARELSEQDFAAFVTNTLREHGLKPSDLSLELTERAFINGDDKTLATNLDTLVTNGVRLVLDDFGTGFSSLAALQRFPLNAIKIDRSFINAIDTPEPQAPIVEAIVSLGRAMRLGVIAEGIETDTQLDYVRELGCFAAQGFKLDRPQSAGDISNLLDSKTAAGETNPLQETLPRGADEPVRDAAASVESPAGSANAVGATAVAA